jgi:hypothetical protein
MRFSGLRVDTLKSRKTTQARRLGQRARLLASLTALILSAGASAAPASAQTQTAWIPWDCALEAGLTTIHTRVGEAVTATFPDSIAPGDSFALSNVTTTVVFPPQAQQQAGALNADGVQGLFRELWTQTTNATTSFSPTAGGNPVNSGPSLFNAVRAVQPPNQPPSVSEVNGGDTSRGGFQPATPAETFSFGDIPTDPSGTSGNAYGPAPGHGGGFGNPNSGTPITLPDIVPITATGSPGQNVVIQNVNGPGGNVAVADVSFHQTNGAYTQPLTARCAFDTSANSTPSPDPSYVSQFTIPIVAPPPPPDIISLSPNSGPGVGGNTVVITGTGFTGDLDVFFGDTRPEFTVDSDTQITATAPPVPDPGTVDVSVQTGNGISPNEADDDYT